MVDEHLNNSLNAMMDAIADPSIWPDALQALAQALGARGAVIIPKALHFPKPSQQAPLGLITSTEVVEPTQRYAIEGWYCHDYRSGFWPGWKAGDVILEQDISSAETRRHHPFYQDFLSKFDLLWWAGLILGAEGHLYAFALQRDSHLGPYEERDRQRLGSIRKHLEATLSLAGRLVRRQAGGHLDLLDTLGHPALLVDWRGQIVQFNTRAKALIDDAFQLLGGRLVARHGPSDVQLQKLITASTEFAPFATLDVHSPIAVKREGRRPLIVESIPLRGACCDLFLGAATLLLLTDLEARPEPSASVLGRLFGLTAAEARLAARLAAGHSLAETAEAFGISRHTARNQLKAIAAKTGVRRQSELASLMVRLVHSP